MSSSLTAQEAAKNDSCTPAAADESLKLAIAMALLKSKLLQKSTAAAGLPPPPPPTSSAPPSSPPPPPPPLSDALQWKRKAKERKQEILRLREELEAAEDGLQYDLFPQIASCKCYFFGNMGQLSPKPFGDGSDRRFSDVLRRRFLRQVRLKERRRKRDASTRRKCSFEYEVGNEIEQLRASVDFLVELCETVTAGKETNFANWSHQAVDFILGTLKNLSSMEKNVEPIEGIVSGLVMRLVQKLCLQKDDLHRFDVDAQHYVQHLVRKLGSEAFIGQRVILSVSQRISVLAESLLFMDPFEEPFPDIHNSLYMMIQLMEFLISDYLLTWSSIEEFDLKLFEEWLASVLHARKALELLESRNGLYVLYMDRVTGEVTKIVGQVPSLQKLSPDVLNNLFR